MSKYHIPGFVELDRLPQPGSLQYPAEDVEPTLCAYPMYYGSDLFDELRSYGVAPEKFINPQWAKMWEILAGLSDEGKLDKASGDLPFFCSYFEAKGFSKVYSRQLISQLSTRTTYRAAAFVWASMLVERYRRAQVTEQTALGVDALKEDKDEESKKELLKAIDIIEDDIGNDKEVEDWKEIARHYAETLGEESEEVLVMPTGVYDLDKLTKGGIRPGDLWVFGGPTGGGKSALMLQCVGYAAKEGARALVVSMEMTKRENLMRVLAGTYGGDFGLLMTDPSKVTPESEAYRHAGGCLAKLKESAPTLKITEKGTQTIETIRGLVRRHRPHIVAIDYLGLVQGERGETREERYSRLSNKLKALAKDFKCAVVTGAQLNDQGKLYGARAIAFDATLVATISPDDGLFIDKVRNAEHPEQPLPYFLDGRRQRFNYDPQR
jgi:replicative DNA helicase